MKQHNNYIVFRQNNPYNIMYTWVISPEVRPVNKRLKFFSEVRKYADIIIYFWQFHAPLHFLSFFYTWLLSVTHIFLQVI